LANPILWFALEDSHGLAWTGAHFSMQLSLATILPTAPRRRTRVEIWLAIVGTILFFGTIAFRNLGHWLDREDPLQTAAAIAVLSGRMPDRALEAARLYNQGYAPQVWLSYSVEPEATLQKYAVPYAGEETYDRLLLLHQGVPESAIRVLDPPIVNTADEMRTFGAALRRENPHRIIIVTSKLHTRRTAALWQRLASRDGQAIVRGVSEDAPSVAYWWRTTGGALDVVREVLGLLNTWAGLPLQPAGS
jgi:uncharacterized SAM-binding protein YcdF (DUF218 family)